MAHFLDPVPYDDAPNLFGSVSHGNGATWGLGEADERARSEDPTLTHHLTADEKKAYLRVQYWTRRNPERPIECAFSRLGVSRADYERAVRKAEISNREAFDCSVHDLIRPGEGLLKDRASRKPRKR